MRAFRSPRLVVSVSIVSVLVFLGLASLGMAMAQGTEDEGVGDQLEDSPYGQILEVPTGTLHSLSIPTAAFVPAQSGLAWEDSGRLGVSSGSGAFRAPVNLPQGAVVEKLTVWGEDNSAFSFTVSLVRNDLAEVTSTNLATVSSTTSMAKLQKLVDDEVFNPTINNGKYSYFVRASFSGVDVSVWGIKIVYLY